MGLTQEELVAKLQAAGVAFTLHTHPPVLTVQAQAEALAGIPGTVVKNIFAKDKKHRLYIISALPSTKIDMNSIGARLGVGKGGLRFAPEEQLEETLKVPLGSVTPLAVANPEAQRVVLFLDAGLQGAAGPLLVHPLVNTASLGMSSAALEQALRALGREPLYVDFGAEPKIDKENPPDLAKHTVEAEKLPAGSEGQGGAGQASSASSSKGSRKDPAAMVAAASAAKPAGGKAAAGVKAGGGAQGGETPALSVYAQHQAATDVAAHTEELLQKVTRSLMGKSLEEGTQQVDSYALRRLRADVESQLTTLKNSAYAMGFTAGKGAVVGYALKQFA